jgi:hypothetical protein
MNNATGSLASGSAENKSLAAGQTRKLAPVPAGGSNAGPGRHDWQDMIATAAYYRAEKRGFDGGSAEEDWYEAEAELRERFGRGGGI